MVFQCLVHWFKMIYWFEPKIDEYTEEWRPAPSDNEQNWRNVAVGYRIIFLQKTMAKAATLRTMRKTGRRGPSFLCSLRKCGKRMSRAREKDSYKWIKDEFFEFSCWKRNQRELHNFGNHENFSYLESLNGNNRNTKQNKQQMQQKNAKVPTNLK